MLVSSTLRFVALLLIVGSVAACKSSEERAADHLQSGLELAEAGDQKRAIVEFRNVLQLDQNNEAARRAMAFALYELGRPKQAYGNFLRVAELNPTDAEARIWLSELAFQARAWEEFDRHAAKAVELDPENPRVKVIDIAMKYRAALEAEDLETTQALATTADSLQPDQPDNYVIRGIIVDAAMRRRDLDRAILELDALIAQFPKERRLYEQKLAIFSENEDVEGFESQLRLMIGTFPEDDNQKPPLIRFLVSRDQLDKAEEFLRSIVDPAGEDIARVMDLVRFVGQVRGDDAAREELNKIIEVAPDPSAYRAALALMDFRGGKREEAVAEMEDILSGAEPSPQSRRIKIGLARMLLAMDNKVGSRALVGEVLAEDARDTDALKMQARWQIDADDVDGAVAGLRAALDSDENDTEAMTLMSEAYSRAGNTDLARDYLAQAVERSNNAPDETLRYANVLISDERYRAAEDILIPALRQSRNNVRILTTLGQLYVRMEDEPRARQVIATLRRLEDNADATTAANGLQAAVLNMSDGREEAIAFLEKLAQDEDAGLNARLSAIRARLATGELETALELIDGFLKEDPDQPSLRFARAATMASMGNLDEAARVYRELLDQDAQRPNVWLELARIKTRQDSLEAGQTVIEEALQKVPDAPDLLWAKASFLERAGDIDGAIEIYETLYAQSSQSLVVANNLASLLGTYREDDESLERAFSIARRFREAEVPALQDTYGWIIHRRGQSEDALPYLEAAAAGLPNDPIVQYHLGVILAALSRNEDALVQFRKSVELAGVADTRDQITAARSEISRLEALVKEGDQSGDQ